MTWIAATASVLFGTGFGWLANRLVLRLRTATAMRGKPASLQYPVVELLAVLAAFVAFLHHPFFLSVHEASSFLFEFFFVLDLIVLAAFDWRWKMLPVEFMLGSVAVFGVWGLLIGRVTVFSFVIGTAVGIAFLGLQVLVSRGKWVGAGDPWLGALLGATLGWPMIGISLYLTYIGGGLVAVILLLSGLAKRGTRLPFAPLLAGGAVTTLWFGNAMIAWMGRIF